MEEQKPSIVEYIESAADGGGEGWITTYGDLMTLLLCFFMLFFNVDKTTIVGVKEQSKEKKITLQVTPEEKQIIDLIRDLLKKMTPKELLEFLKKKLEDIKRMEELNLSKEELEKLKKQEEILKKQLEALKDNVPLEKIQKALEKALEKDQSIEQLKEEMKDTIEKLRIKEDIKFTENKETLEIVFPNKQFFASGSADLLPLANTLFTKFADMAKVMKFPVQVDVEGHTDSDKMSSGKFPSNWELSTARASSVVRLLVKKGLSEKFLSAQGFADQKPILPERDKKGKKIPANQAFNRRIVLKLTKFVDQKKVDLKKTPNNNTGDNNEK